MLKKLWLNLQLFGDGGGDGGDGGSASASVGEAIGGKNDDSGENKIPASIPEKAKKYAELLYAQSLLIAGLPLEDPSGYTDLVCELMV